MIESSSPLLETVCACGLSRLSLLPISQGNVSSPIPPSAFPILGNSAREIKRAKWGKRESRGESNLYDSSSPYKLRLGLERANVRSMDKIDRAVRTTLFLHFEWEHYATLWSSERETLDEHLTLSIDDGRKWRVGSLRRMAKEMKKGAKDHKKITIMDYDKSNLSLL